MQTARLLFRMSLMHLPLYLLCGAIHRRPNDGTVSWAAAQRWLQDSVEVCERQLWRSVHGGSEHSGSDRVALQQQLQRGSAERPQSGASMNSVPTGAMIFPFSPPVVVPCPYAAVVDQLSSGGSRQRDGSESSPGVSAQEKLQYSAEMLEADDKG